MHNLLKPSEVAEKLRVTRRQVYRLVDEGELQGIRIGKGSVRIPAESVEALIERGKTECS